MRRTSRRRASEPSARRWQKPSAATSLARAGLAAPRRAGPHEQAQGPHRRGHRDSSGSAPRRRPGRRRCRCTRTRLGSATRWSSCTASATGSTDGPRLFAGTSISLLDPRERLGIVGPNGAGKSTLLDLVAGRFPADRRPSRAPADRPTRRTTTRSDATSIPTQRVRDAVAGPARRPDWHDAALLSAFWFDGDAQWAPIGTLSRWRTATAAAAADAGRATERAAARRADQRSRPRHAPLARRLPRRLAWRARSW